MVRTAVFLHAHQIERLHALSESTGAVVSELIRRAVDAYLEQRKAEVARK
jgi:predicted DNA-binding protein